MGFFYFSFVDEKFTEIVLLDLSTSRQCMHGMS